MALAPRDIPVTRENVVQWHAAWVKVKRHTSETWEEFLRRKIDDLDIEDRMVNTTEHEGLGNETSIADMILLDMESYGFDTD